MAEIEWEETSAPLPAPEPPGSRRRVRLVLRTLGVVAVAAAAAITLTHQTSTSGHDSGPPAPSAEQQAASDVAGAAASVPITYVRQDAPHGGCAVLTPGQSPQTTVLAATRARLPGYRLLDLGRTLDEYGGLCSLTIRERDAAGSVLVVLIAASTQTAQHSGATPTVSHSTTAAGTLTAAHLQTADGWSVTVGAVGPRGDQPAGATLLEIAKNPAIRW